MFKIPSNPYRKQQIVLGLLSLICLVGLVLYVPPLFIADVAWFQSYLPFLLLIGLTMFWLCLSMCAKWKQSGFVAVVFSMFVWLRINQLDTTINLLLLTAFIVVIEWYWKLDKPKARIE